jgi:hypothetical protein
MHGRQAESADEQLQMVAALDVYRLNGEVARVA